MDLSNSEFDELFEMIDQHSEEIGRREEDPAVALHYRPEAAHFHEIMPVMDRMELYFQQGWRDHKAGRKEKVTQRLDKIEELNKQLAQYDPKSAKLVTKTLAALRALT